MAAQIPREELLEQEVTELTDLLRHEDSFASIREMLAAKGLSASELVLAGLIDGIDGSRYGVILTHGYECIRFEIAPNGSLAMWDKIDELDDLKSGFQAVPTGISMMRRGQIS
jgi:hypothetical protein